MQRNNLLSKLKQYTLYNVNEKQMYQSLVEFVKSNSDCFQNTLEIGHITGSAWIIDLHQQKVLLTHHKKLSKWLQLGGMQMVNQV
jgi:hypothetical protein